MKLSKKAQGVMGGIGALGIGVATLAIVLVVTFLIISQARTQIISLESLNVATNTSSVALNATNTLSGAVATIPGWVPLVIIASIGGLLLGLVALFKR